MKQIRIEPYRLAAVMANKLQVTANGFNPFAKPEDNLVVSYTLSRHSDQIGTTVTEDGSFNGTFTIQYNVLDWSSQEALQDSLVDVVVKGIGATIVP